MDKDEIKKKLLEAVKSDPHFADIRFVAIFGSHVRGQAEQGSDVDVLIEFEPEAEIGYFALSEIKENFERFVEGTVDLLTPAALSEYFREDVLEQAECVYEK